MKWKPNKQKKYTAKTTKKKQRHTRAAAATAKKAHTYCIYIENEKYIYVDINSYLIRNIFEQLKKLDYKERIVKMRRKIQNPTFQMATKRTGVTKMEERKKIYIFNRKKNWWKELREKNGPQQTGKKRWVSLHVPRRRWRQPQLRN